MAVAGKQIRMYHTVPNFNPKSSACWQLLRETAAQEAKTTGEATVIAFIDADDFTPGKDGMYDKAEALQRKVIAQVLVNNSIDLYVFTPDPFDSGKYIESK
jgi:hypothetical protein